MTKKRAKRDERPEKISSIRLTSRDLSIMQAVYEYRLLSTQQLTRLFFPSEHTAYARLALLYGHGYLERVFMGVQSSKMNTPILYILDKRGAEILRAELGIDVVWRGNLKDVKPDFLEHALAINDVRVAVTIACKQSDDFQLKKWLGDQDLKADYDYVSIRVREHGLKRVSLIPDSYFVLKIPQGNLHFFLEQDMGKMDLGRFKQKVLAYLSYAASGLSEERFGTRLFRVLTVASSARRAKSLQNATQAIGGESRFWFAHSELIQNANVLTAPIWSVAGQETQCALID